MLQAQAAATCSLGSPVRSPNPLPTRDPLILRLPVELTLIIFDHCSTSVRARLSLSHTCRHWMSITSKTSTLWTSVQIVVQHPAESKLFDNLISLLEMQLEHAAGMPLDVVWASYQPSAFDPRLMNLLRRKGPFSQWRTLEAMFLAAHPDDANVFHPGDAFSNLESITIFSSVRTSIIRVLNRTTTSKLQVLDDRMMRPPGEVTTLDFKELISRICYLKTSSSKTSGLPNNITELDIPHQASHPFPHLKTYNVELCSFSPDGIPDLRHLTILNVTAVLVFFPGTELSLPSLRQMTYGMIHIMGTTKVSSPLLESLHVTGHCPIDLKHDLGDCTQDSIENDCFLFSPSSSLTMELNLPFDSIVKLLERSPHLQRVSFGFSDKGCAMRVLERIGTAGVEDYSEGVRLCGRLRELRLTLLWDKCDVESWKELAAQAANNRMGNGIELRVYATWKGEGTYMLLA